MSNLQENPGLNAELARIAQSHVDAAHVKYSVGFDFSEGSLRWVDDAIAKFHPDGTVPDESVIGFGAYVGETIRRLVGGIWVQDERGVALLQRVGGRELSASPFSWVQSRCSYGMEHSVAAKYTELQKQIAPVGVRIAKPASPAATAATAPATASAAATAEDVQLLCRSPLVVFMLVAAADGKVDKKELASFIDIITGIMGMEGEEGDSPLFRQAITDLLPQMGKFVAGMSDWDPGEELERVRTILDTHYPNEAETFKRLLIATALKVASASGGFLGMGSKISKDEKMAIGAIAVTLGLVGDEEEEAG